MNLPHETGHLPVAPIPRAAWALAALVIGFALARLEMPIPSSLWFAFAVGCCGIAGVRSNRGVRWVLMLAAVCFGAGWMQMRIAPIAGAWMTLARESSPIIEVEGTFEEEPRAIEPLRSPLVPRDAASWSVRFHVDSIIGSGGAVRARGTLLVRGDGALVGPVAACRAGDRARLVGIFRAPSGPNNPGERDQRLYAAQDSRVGSIRLASGDGVTRLEARTWLERWRGWSLRTRAEASRRAEGLVVPDRAEADAESRSLLRALVLGDEPGTRDLDDVRTSFAHTGLAHVLSISGFHLVVMVWFALVVLRLFGDLGSWESLAVAAVLAVYLAILPFDAPVWRSAMMVLALLLAEACGRRYDRLAILCWVAVALLLYRPLDAGSMGFQLSFGLVAVLIRFGERLHHRLWGERLLGVTTRAAMKRPAWMNASFDSLKALLSTNILCAVTSMPIVAFHTGTVSPLSPIIGLVAVPIVSILLMLAYAALLLGTILPFLAGAMASTLVWLSGLVAAFVRWCDAIPGAWFVLPRLSLPWCIAATACALWLAWNWGWWRRRHALPWIALGVVTIWTIGEIAFGSRLPQRDILRLDTFAVGDGTCHLVRSGGDAMLWDAGSLERGVGLGRTTLPRALREVGAWRVRTAVVTHPNLDHYNALPAMAEAIGLREVLVSPLFLSRAANHPKGGEAFAIEALKTKGVRVRAIEVGAMMKLGECDVTFLSPPKGITEADWPHDNDHCLVGRFDVAAKGSTKAGDSATALLLLVGDIEAPAIERIEADDPELHARVMEAPHHGSAKQAAMRWMQRVHPSLVVQSTGPKRARDPRWDGVRSALGPFSRWWCTAIDGAIRVEWKRDGSIVSMPFHSPSDMPAGIPAIEEKKEEESAGSNPRP